MACLSPTIPSWVGSENRGRRGGRENRREGGRGREREETMTVSGVIITTFTHASIQLRARCVLYIQTCFIHVN